MMSLCARTHNRRSREFALSYLCRVIRRINGAGLDEHRSWAVHLIAAEPMYMVREGLQPEDLDLRYIDGCSSAKENVSCLQAS